MANRVPQLLNEHPGDCKPDPNIFLRYKTKYLSQISENIYQTEVGVIHLLEEYRGAKLQHDEDIMVLGRMVEEGKIEGTVKKCSNGEAFRRWALQMPLRSKPTPLQFVRKVKAYSMVNSPPITPITSSLITPPLVPPPITPPL